ncbi:hypothetical protein ACWDWO_18615 [Actinopolymorpha singaporensis]|uniref:Uncharacterized protein n=1 Tax=Actinopolymorpha singaporensis TaxID=117157 RepID=A0A1H1NYM2_9ACTN|nr:hypothetical protein [Actinopolymorpha singaporensis]SDS03469.1 hypothetical protein SAMN04489717_1402 [Actinopolymorpha singaporensis]
MRIGPLTAASAAGACVLGFVVVLLEVLPPSALVWVGLPTVVALCLGYGGVVGAGVRGLRGVAGIRRLGVLADLGLGAFGTTGLALAALGVMLSADSGRLPVPTAAVLGLLALAYLVLVELAQSLAGEDGWQPEGTRAAGSGATTAGLPGWVRTVAPLLAAGLTGAVVLSVVVVLPLPPAAWLVVTAPAILAVAVILALPRRSGR